MRALIFFSFLQIFFFSVYAQQNNEVKKLVNDGIALQNKGYFDSAIIKYDEALAINKEDFDAMYQKSFSCLSAKRITECIDLCKQLIQTYPFHPSIEQVYTNWGTAANEEGKWQDAIDVYDKGLAASPLFYTLYYNKGLTYMHNSKNADAIKSYIAALKFNPLHSSSNYYLGLLLQQDNRMAALLSLALFIATEPQTERSKKAFDAIQQIIQASSKKGDSSVTVSTDTLNNKVENDFAIIDSTFSLMGVVDKELNSTAKSEAEKFDVKFQLLIDAMAQSKQDKKGLFWERYVPFFVQLKEKNFTLVLSNLIYLSKNARAQLWVSNHVQSVGEFYQWLEERFW